MIVTLDELEARMRAAHDQEQILIWLLGGQSAYIAGPDEIPRRIEALGDTYQRIVIALSELADLSPAGDNGCPTTTER